MGEKYLEANDTGDDIFGQGLGTAQFGYLYGNKRTVS